MVCYNSFKASIAEIGFSKYELAVKTIAVKAKVAFQIYS